MMASAKAAVDRFVSIVPGVVELLVAVRADREVVEVMEDYPQVSVADDVVVLVVYTLLEIEEGYPIALGPLLHINSRLPGRLHGLHVGAGHGRGDAHPAGPLQDHAEGGGEGAGPGPGNEFPFLPLEPHGTAVGGEDHPVPEVMFPQELEGVNGHGGEPRHQARTGSSEYQSQFPTGA
jgi:hypothetical protein